MSSARTLLRVKPAEQLTEESSHTPLRRTLGLVPLVALSVGATLGTGIFVVLADAAPSAGPAVVVSFVLAGLAALCSALSYAELAGSVPMSGSAYSYTYATMGELVAWVCGWCLLLEYGVSVAAVAVGWGGYLNEFLQGTIGMTIPEALSAPPGEGGLVNIPAAVVVLLATGVLLLGVRESARATTVVTLLKIGILVFFVAVAVTGFRSVNMSPFAPMGFAGISAGASAVFFSFIGFDAASTAGEEARDPKRDLPRAIMLSLSIVTALYVLVALAAVGAVGAGALGGSDASLAMVLQTVTRQGWPSVVLAFGAVLAIASVVLTVLYGQTRILVSMSRDGLMPQMFSRVNRRAVPARNTALVGVLVAVLASVVPLSRLAEATSIGTLVAFGLVNIGVLILRRNRPDLNRSFRTPLMPWTPLLGVALCGYLITGLDAVTWLAFALWSAAGLAVYFLYGMRRSKLARQDAEQVRG
ncbi:amino acid/polyamine/organocation transporter (APC superfamily) [Halopolyspora algeriensis]|uniref:Amino acid/polyamine/organocation transporter (APC superfamily) n=1 Tax=Halopolyspora algeriensis TaxID=1500506 RepID=A0A368VTX8_9ACTN|nr:amino acid permease [Halopolyspora algeriensis]RCW45219.1 amino acid/polyamine/organocation transporter (APC superfamily) [Halopolyspora algeriensis]TQM53062.1 amino acid/polyamine/organocation transporter (APC superfamily) [Halopolyspora algeriensis]